ncbi:MAG: hypothetical protein H5T49_06140 [Hadesarchaea archaeon]|nr:hypothetical protein [Hadesarchaea archaeon]
MVDKKGEVRVFVDGIYLKIIDDLIRSGYGTNRSEVIRKMVHDWTMTYLEKAKALMEYAKEK